MAARSRSTQGGYHADRKIEAPSPKSEYVVVRVDVRRGLRVVTSFSIGLLGSARRQADVIETTRTQMPGGHWLKIVPKEPLSFGEYALVEVLDDRNREHRRLGLRRADLLPDRIATRFCRKNATLRCSLRGAPSLRQAGLSPLASSSSLDALSSAIPSAQVAPSPWLLGYLAFDGSLRKDGTLPGNRDVVPGRSFYVVHHVVGGLDDALDVRAILGKRGQAERTAQLKRKAFTRLESGPRAGC